MSRYSWPLNPLPPPISIAELLVTEMTKERWRRQAITDFSLDGKPRLGLTELRNYIDALQIDNRKQLLTGCPEDLLAYKKNITFTLRSSGARIEAGLCYITGYGDVSLSDGTHESLMQFTARMTTSYVVPNNPASMHAYALPNINYYSSDLIFYAIFNPVNLNITPIAVDSEIGLFAAIQGK